MAANDKIEIKIGKASMALDFHEYVSAVGILHLLMYRRDGPVALYMLMNAGSEYLNIPSGIREVLLELGILRATSSGIVAYHSVKLVALAFAEQEDFRKELERMILNDEKKLIAFPTLTMISKKGK